MFSTRAAHRKDGKTQFTQSLLRAIIDENQVVSQTNWVLALVRKKGTEHAFLLIEGQKGADRTIFRSDLFLASRNRPQITHALNCIDTIGAVEKLWSYSASSGHGTAFIRLTELSEDEYDALIDIDHSEYQSWGIHISEAENLMQYLINEADRPCIPYHIAGDHPIWMSSTSTSYYHNCVSWCETVIRDVFEGRLEVGSRWGTLIRRPSEVIQKVKQMASESSPAPQPGFNLV